MIIHQYIPFLFKRLISIGCKMVIFLPSVFLLYLLVDVTIIFSEGSSSWFPYKYDQIKDFFKVIFKSTLKMLSRFSFNFALSMLHVKKPRADISYCST